MKKEPIKILLAAAFFGCTAVHAAPNFNAADLAEGVRAAAAARSHVHEILSDQSIDSTEADQLRDGAANAPHPRARFIYQLMTKPSDLNLSLDGRAGGWQTIAELALATERFRTNILGVIGNRYAKLWKRSTIYNVYKPVRDWDESTLKLINAAPVDLQLTSLELLRDGYALYRAHPSAKDQKIPPYIYKWIDDEIDKREE